MTGWMTEARVQEIRTWLEYANHPNAGLDGWKSRFRECVPDLLAHIDAQAQRIADLEREHQLLVDTEAILYERNQRIARLEDALRLIAFCNEEALSAENKVEGMVLIAHAALTGPKETP